MPISSALELETELQFFEAHRAELVAQAKGRYALVKGDRLVGLFNDQNEAVRAGYETFGNQAFLVKLITDVDIPLNFTSFNMGI